MDLYSVRDEWREYDLLSKDGIKIEVKSSAYIQTWYQKAFTSVTFSIRPASAWNPNTGKLEGDTKRQSDVYVFCLLKHKEQNTLDPLKLEQWEFYVVPTKSLDADFQNHGSISLNSLRKITKAIKYADLSNAIDHAIK